jgi:hypothetical protein
VICSHLLNLNLSNNYVTSCQSITKVGQFPHDSSELFATDASSSFVSVSSSTAVLLVKGSLAIVGARQRVYGDMDPAGQAAILTQLQTEVQTLQAAAAAAAVPPVGPPAPPVLRLSRHWPTLPPTLI